MTYRTCLACKVVGPPSATQGTRAEPVGFVSLYLSELLQVRPTEVRDEPCLAYGSGGIAYALCRTAVRACDICRPKLLASARKWIQRSLVAAQTLTYPDWPRHSFSRGFAGLYATGAMIESLSNRPAPARRFIGLYLARVRRSFRSPELFEGAAGHLAGIAMLLMLPWSDAETRKLQRTGDAIARRLITRLRKPTASLSRAGIAHGRAGLVLALVQWLAWSKSIDRNEVGALVGACRAQRNNPFWANGSAGMVQLFALAERALPNRGFKSRARTQALRSVAAADSGHPMVIDGPPGIALALLELASVDPSGAWRRRARNVMKSTLARLEVPEQRIYGLWGGLSGLYCLALDLQYGSWSGFPGLGA